MLPVFRIPQRSITDGLDFCLPVFRFAGLTIVVDFRTLLYFLLPGFRFVHLNIVVDFGKFCSSFYTGSDLLI